MNRTQWPLLNRARIHGVVSTMQGGPTSIAPFKINPNYVIPMNIQYAQDTYPVIKKRDYPDEDKRVKLITERNTRLYSFSALRAPFPEMWFEWQDKSSDETGNKNLDCYVICCEDPDDKDVFRLMVGWESERNRIEFRSQPVVCYFSSPFNYSDFVDKFPHGESGLPIVPLELAEKLAEQQNISVNHFAQGGVSSVGVALWALLLLSCKNVTTVESQPCYRNNKRQKDPSRVVHRELHVQVPPGRKRSHSLSESDEKVGTAFHVRMGHFADYTQGKGLFGKYHGKYWIPAITVGDVDYGTVLKSYKLEGVSK